MDPLTEHHLAELLGAQGSVVSILLPTERGGRWAAQGRVRLKNALRRVAAALADRGAAHGEGAGILQAGESLLQDDSFWQRQADGLALYLWPGQARAYRVFWPLTEFARVAPRPYVLPLLPLAAARRRFAVLGLSGNRVRLLFCRRDEVQPLAAPGLPESFDALRHHLEHQRRMQFHSGAAPVGAATRPPGFHGAAAAGDETALRTYHLEYCRLVNQPVQKLLRDAGQPPLVLVADVGLATLYRQVNTCPTLTGRSVTGNPDHLTDHGLRDVALPAVEDHWREAVTAAVHQYRELGPQRTSADLDAILLGAADGRVQTLLVEDGVHRWGALDTTTRQVRSAARPGPADEDLLNAAACLTLAARGTVHVLPRRDMPVDTPLAATWRY